ncbi:unnamed protein product, partial [marine sediment metagenome]
MPKVELGHKEIGQGNAPITRGSDQAAAGFELPDWLRKRLRGGVSEYDMPPALQMLLWQGAMRGQTDPLMMQRAAESMFTPERFLAEDTEW